MNQIYVEAEKSQIDDFKRLSDDDLFHKVDCLPLHGYEERDLFDAWDALHYVMTGLPAKSVIAGNPFSEAILGTHRFIEAPKARYIAYVYPERVKEIASALDEYDFEAAVERVSLQELNEKNIKPMPWEDAHYPGRAKECLNDDFTCIREFFDLARDHGMGVIIRLTERCEGRRCIFFKGE